MGTSYRAKILIVISAFLFLAGCAVAPMIPDIGPAPKTIERGTWRMENATELNYFCVDNATFLSTTGSNDTRELGAGKGGKDLVMFQASTTLMDKISDHCMTRDEIETMVGSDNTVKNAEKKGSHV